MSGAGITEQTPIRRFGVGCDHPGCTMVVMGTDSATPRELAQAAGWLVEVAPGGARLDLCPWHRTGKTT